MASSTYSASYPAFTGSPVTRWASEEAGAGSSLPVEEEPAVAGVVGGVAVGAKCVWVPVTGARCTAWGL